MREALKASETSFIQNFRRLIEIASRRRFLILAPLLVSIPLSIMGAAMVPASYTARTLLFFQYSGNDPLQVETFRYRTGPPSLYGEINALLKSGYILDASMKQVMGDEYPKTAKQQALARDSLAASLSVIQIGRSFYEFRLKARDPVGLGEKLEVITSRFLESLLTGGRSPASSVRVVLNRRKLEMEQAKKAIEEFEQTTARGQAGGNMLMKARQLGEMDRRLEIKKEELAILEFDINKVLSETRHEQAERTPQGGEIVAKPIEDRSLKTTLLAKLIKAPRDTIMNQPAIAGSSEPVAARKPLAALPKIAELNAKRLRLKGEVDRLDSDIQRIKAFLADRERTIELGERLSQRLQDSTSIYDNYARLYASTTRAFERPLDLVGSPGSIKVIDPPEDPKVPDVSRMIYIAAGILAGLVLGCGAAIGAELFDERPRRPHEFVATLGVPMICRLPTSHGIEDSLSPQIESTGTMYSATQPRQAPSA